MVDTEKLIKLEALRTDSIEKEEEIRKKIEKIDKESYVRLKETNRNELQKSAELSLPFNF